MRTLEPLPFPFSLWPVPETLAERPDIIVAPDYGVTRERKNSNATICAIKQAAILKRKRYTDALILFATSSHSFEGSDEVSTAQKLAEFESFGIGPVDYMYAGPIVNTVSEARAIYTALIYRLSAIQEILVISERVHSRDVLYVYRSVFRGKRITIQYLQENAWQKNHIFPAQQSRSAWLFANLKRFVALRVLGLNWVERHGIHKAA